LGKISEGARGTERRENGPGLLERGEKRGQTDTTDGFSGNQTPENGSGGEPKRGGRRETFWLPRVSALNAEMWLFAGNTRGERKKRKKSFLRSVGPKGGLRFVLAKTPFLWVAENVCSDLP